MPPYDIMPLAAIALLCATGLACFRMWIAGRTRRHHEVQGEKVERLADAVDGLYEQMGEMRDSIAELHERVDFAERLLTKGNQRDVKRLNASTPV
ncbi:MAG: hypothetical protein GTN62_06390 [Gemmatimonadales bacterium]|nr:hypothetical protein [Gemmatimonadales bacterium]NIN11126.1 hypothetical protein [Gemmatimonadales bacterium]NIN49725.1 hypothetical protein [Gemmatimonadales bacterium]NIP07189.1 hypothetical protein [Gemmatimonadales bacterium]NIR00402.1 hypothetical protein [Gemmatimonadales bacterium]